MKKLLCAVMACIFLCSCSQPAPDTYDFYNGFVAPTGIPITVADTEKYKDTTISENTAILREKLNTDNLNAHQLFELKNAIIINFSLHYSATQQEIAALREYAYETFWLGKMHTSDTLPYENWQYSHMIKDLTVQIYNEEGLVLQDVYTFDKLTDNGDKLYSLTTTENTDNYFSGTYIYLGDYLKGTEEQLEQYTNLESIAGQTVYTSIRQTLTKDKMYVELMTEEKQLDPYVLNDIYTAVIERYSFINGNIYINLYVADKGMYYQYNSPVELPPQE